LDFELDLEFAELTDSAEPVTSVSRLIEFPGVTRRTMPEWRKELSARVREVQERRAREAAAEAEEAARLEREASEVEVTTPPQLELIPHVEEQKINPVLAAALRRIERAHQSTPANTYSRAATAVAVVRDQQTETHYVAEAVTAPALEAPMPSESAPIPERTHNLVVVQAPVAKEPEPTVEKPKPRRVIAEDDPALSYLDSIASVYGPADVEDRAPLAKRIVAAFIDIIAVGFLTLPVAAVIELQDGNWHQPKILALMAGIGAVFMFLYATVTTALTGRTLGMRILSLRAVDVRTGLIPTGNQSAGRALFYLLSLAMLGIGLLAFFARGEGKTLHDRLTRTAVIRD
jgi:uncharacterized RDD family membrane protein YckC